jgi:uncharacterized repeat protein (TIGR02543 family)
MFKVIRAALVAVLAAVSLVAVSAPAHAAYSASNVFSCSPNFYQAASDVMYQYNPSTNAYTQMPGTATTSGTLNAIGYNPADNLIYGTSGTNLVTVDNTGAHATEVAISGTSYNTGGDFIAPNKLLTENGSGSFALIDTTTHTGTAFTATGTSWPAYDIAFDPNTKVGYGLDNNTLYIATFNAALTSLNVTTKTLANTGNLHSPSTTAWGSTARWGAAYVDSSGNAYFFNNNDHQLWEVSTSELANPNPTATFIVDPGSGLSAPNDGASCAAASSPLAPIATTQAATSVANTSATLNGSVTTQARTGSNITAGNLQFCYSTSSDVHAGLLSVSPVCANASTNTQAANLGNVANSLAITGLTAGTTYYFQIVTTDVNGLQGNGAVLNFTTTGGGSPSYTVTFDGSTPTSGSMSNQTASSATNLTSNGFTKTGYTFGGWATASGGTTVAYINGQSYPFTSSVTLYAIWNAVTTYTVTFDGSTPTSGSMSSQTASSATNLTSNGFSKTGFTFGGWATTSGGTTVAYTNGQSYPFTSSVTLYAIWNAVATYTVTFDPNGGSGSMSNQTASSATNLTANAYGNSGYTFGGWATSSGSSTVAYANSASYPFTSSTTLYAIWTANPPAPSSWTVNFNSQGGTQFPSSSYTANGCVNLPGTPVMTGYTFVGWYVAPVANSLLSSPYCPGGSGNITLYAHWTPNNYTVTYNPQGGSAVPNGTYPTGGSITLAGPSSMNGYTFGGWSLSPNGSAQASPYTPGAAGNVTFYAIWTANSYPVNFNPNGGTPGATGNFTTGGSLPLAPAPSLPGYTFTGWFLAPTGGSALTSPYSPGAAGALTLFAQWAPITYKVAFNTQGGSSVDDSSYQTAGCVNLPAAPTRDGYTFTGWFAATDGGTALANPYCPTGTGDISVYAQWTKNAEPTPVTPAKRGPVTVVISGFADGSPVLTKTIKAKIDAFLKKYNDYKVIQCVGFTEGPTVLKTDKALSLARANNSCNYALAGLGKGLKAKAAKFGNDTVEQAQLRRVEITLSDE